MIRITKETQHSTYQILNYLNYIGIGLIGFNIMFGFFYLMPIFHMSFGMPSNLLLGNVFGIFINTLIYLALIFLIRKLKKDQEMIKENELKYRTLFDFSGDMVYLFELKEDLMPGVVLEINDSACRKLGYTKDELLKMNPLEFTSHDRLSKIKELQLELVRTGTLSFEGRYVSKDGQYIPSDITANVFQLDNKKVVLAIARDITERKLLEEKLHYLAYHDSLTGLPNRDFLKKHLCSLSMGTQVAVLFIDLDGFKEINDTLGHDCGDQLIKLAAVKFTSSIQNNGMVSRFGGDEFLILLENAHVNDAIQTAESIIHAFSFPFLLEDHEAKVTVSIGISLSKLGEKDIDQVIKEADTAMYLAKENGKNNYFINETHIQNI
ncbi:diguanylate cyclase domain-containing protein [Neobacillus sp. D3-1R]|uniref:PAS domain-containing protein n=1 Tax=Neobacillus sp. D3-1R TaxID=3445778 RepID=UPI003F9FBCDA